MLYFYDTDDIKTETDGKDVLLMSYQKLFRTAASSVITYLEDKDIDILIFDESHRMGAKTVREKWNRTKGISRAEAEAVLRQFDKNTLRAVKTYIYHNRELDISTISETVGSKRTLVCQSC